MLMYLGGGWGWGKERKALAAHPSHQHASILLHAAHCLGLPQPGPSLGGPTYEIHQHPSLVSWLQRSSRYESTHAGGEAGCDQPTRTTHHLQYCGLSLGYLPLSRRSGHDWMV